MNSSAPPGLYPTQQPEAARTTAATIGAAGAATAALGATSGAPVATILGILGVVAAVYELYAIRTDRVPTITEAVKGGGWPVRISFVAVAILAFIDHFITGLVL